MSGSAGGRAEQNLLRQAPHRAAEPTAWLGRCRRLTRDYARRPDSNEAMIMWSMTRLMTRRLAPPARARTVPTAP